MLSGVIESAALPEHALLPSLSSNWPLLPKIKWLWFVWTAKIEMWTALKWELVIEKGNKLPQSMDKWTILEIKKQKIKAQSAETFWGWINKKFWVPILEM